MSDYKILLTTHSTAFLTSGGGESELVQVAEILRDTGIQADIYGIGSRPLRFYDAVMHFSVHADGDSMVREARRRESPLFLWPNVWWNDPPSQPEIDRISAICQSARKVLFKSESELENFQRHIQIHDGKAEIVPTCVSSRFLAEVDKDLASTVTGATDYALCLGLIEPVKNQLQLVRALNLIRMDGVFVGGPRDDEYYRQCVEEAHSGIVFLPFVQPCSALLRSIIYGCSVMVEVSDDPPGRSCLEGATMQKPLIMRDGPWQREHFGEDVWYTPDRTPEALANVIRSMQADPERELRIFSAQKRVLHRHSAHAVGAQLARLLEERGG